MSSKLDGKTGKEDVWVKSSPAVIVKPITRKVIEAIIPKTGPATPKSNIDLRFGGGDFRGVMVPIHPIWREGTGVGKPTSNCFGSATVSEYMRSAES